MAVLKCWEAPPDFGFRESGLQDNVTIANLQNACLKLVLARARARELQVDQQVERAQQSLSPKTASQKPKGPSETDKAVCHFFLKPDGCKNGDTCQYARPRTDGIEVCDVAQSHTISRLVPVLADNSLLDPAVPAPRKPYAKPKGRAADAQTSSQGNQENAKGESKKGRQTKPTAKSGDVDFDENAQAEQEEPEQPQEHDEDQEDDQEAYCVEAQSTSESEMDSDGTREWRGPCCLVRVHRQLRRCLFTPTWKEDIWQGLTV